MNENMKKNNYLKMIEETAVSNCRKNYDYFSVINNKIEDAYKEIIAKVFNGNDDEFSRYINDILSSYGVHDLNNIDFQSIHLKILTKCICKYIFEEFNKFPDPYIKTSFEHIESVIKVIKHENYHRYNFPTLDLELNEEILLKNIASTYKEEYNIRYEKINGNIMIFYNDEEFLNYMFLPHEISDDDWNKFKIGLQVHRKHYLEFFRIFINIRENWKMFEQ